MGIYTDDKLPEQIGSMIPITDVERDQLWDQLTGMTLYDDSTHKGSNIRDLRIRILHRLITIAFYGHLESIGNVTHRDLAIINAILSSQFICPTRMLAEELLKIAGKLPNQAITRGAFITRLAHGLSVVTDDMTVVGQNLRLSMQMLKNIKLGGVDRHRHFLLTKSGQEWTEVEQGTGVISESRFSHFLTLRWSFVICFKHRPWDPKKDHHGLLRLPTITCHYV